MLSNPQDSLHATHRAKKNRHKQCNTLVVHAAKTFRYSYLNTTYSSVSIEYHKSLKSYIDALF